jgi:pilus assembly protein CpaC
MLCAVARPALSQTDTEDLRLTIGKSVVVDYPADIGRISTSSPEVVDAVAVTTREFLLHGKGAGSGTVVVWAKTGQRTIYSVVVDQNLDPLRKLVRDTFPSENIQVQGARDSISLTGRVSSQAVADRAVALVTPAAKTIVNNLQVTQLTEQQVLLRVKFAEMNRNLATSYGVNILSTGALNTVGRVSTGQFAGPQPSNLSGNIPGRIEGTTSSFSISDALNVFAFRPDLNLSLFVKALENEGVLQIIAEPNLVTTNGKEASFLVGGEFPIPVLQGGSNAGSVTVMFKEFGIRLKFLPLLTPNKTIKMQVNPEVSTIDLANAVVFSGFTIPALSTRRMTTDIELAEGQSFIIAGLLDDRVTDNLNKIPGLANIPILGALFKSREEKKNKTELVVMVTPEIASPLNATDPKPTPVMPREFLPPTKPPLQSKNGLRSNGVTQAAKRK